MSDDTPDAESDGGSDGDKPPDREHRDQLDDEELLAFMRTLEGGLPTAAPWNLADAADHDRRRILEDLGRWVAWLTARYRLADVIPDCWAAHGALVEELLALRFAWRDAYSRPDAHQGAPLAWHDAFARARDRIREWNRWGCAADIHRPEPPSLKPERVLRP
jgi:hypothetical protein